ncbi:MAG TPA: hypothetical protein VGJ15_02265 [Pirellulales bacterium]
MASNQRSPLWPYMLVLSGLFALTLALPRGDGNGNSDEPNLLVKHRTGAKHAAPSAIVRANSDGALDPPVGPMPGDFNWTSDNNNSTSQSLAGSGRHMPIDAQLGGNTMNSGVAAESADEGGFVESVAKKIADLRQFGMQNLIARADSAGGEKRSAAVNAATASIGGRIGDTVYGDGKLPPELDLRQFEEAGTAAGSSHDNTAITPNSSLANTIRPNGTTLVSNYCPIPRNLLQQLDRLDKTAATHDWAVQVEAAVVDLCHVSPGEPQRLAELVAQLQNLAAASDTLAEQTSDGATAEQIRRVHDGLDRRLILWSALFSQPRSTVYANMAAGGQQRQRLNSALADVDARLRAMAYADGWRRYLQLDQIAKLADGSHPLADDEAAQIAHNALQRLSPAQVSDAQRQVLDDPAIKSLAELLHGWAAEMTDGAGLLTALEQYEATGLPSDARQFAAAKLALGNSTSPQDRQLADQLDQHYRNANVRIAVSGDLINRLLPDPQPSTGVVSDTILGAMVNGKSQTTTQLHVHLVPDPARVHLLFEAEGLVDSQTQATRGPATFTSHGEANFTVRKAVILDSNGLMTAKALAMADSATQLTGVHTTMDGKPLVGNIARRVAAREEQSKRDEAKQEIDQKVAAQAEARMNADVDRRLKQADEQAGIQLLDPLKKLDVPAEPIAFETNVNRFSLRLRLAGESQLGGHTLRPLAPSDSLLSVQVHESALNNVLDQLQLAGRTFTPAELYRHLSERLSAPSLKAPADLPTDVSIKFAPADPVRLRCENGIVRVTLVIDELTQGTRHWHDFQITATYDPQLDHLHARLVRQGAIELGGETYKGQPELALRGIFAKVLPREKPLDLIPPFVTENAELADLGVTQCTVEDGWIGLAIGPMRNSTPAKVATPPAAISLPPATAEMPSVLKR